MKRSYEILWATLSEAGLILVVAAAGWAVRQPLLFASLGPTVYEFVEQPRAKSSRAYNVIAGHLIALGSGFFAIWVLNAWSVPNVFSLGTVAPQRVWAAVIASALTTFLTLFVKASQPAALSTTLLVSLGLMQSPRDVTAIVLGVLVVTAIGEPLRRLRLRLANTTADTREF